jgi:glyoxylate/hydroxypyruvate reductase A
MFEYILATVSYQAMRLHRFNQLQQLKEWDEITPRGFGGTVVGIFGLGSIGSYVAQRLSRLGFVIKGFANSPKEIEGVETYTPRSIADSVMKSLDIVVSILPLTAQTEGFFDQSFFDRLKTGASFINVGRGPQVVENDLLCSLKSNHLSHAWLDVFDQEPLSEDHPYWSHPNISITPHIASITDPASVASQIVENYHAAMQGKTLHNVVDRKMGY